jgi:hypothetical protein
MCHSVHVWALYEVVQFCPCAEAAGRSRWTSSEVVYAPPDTRLRHETSECQYFAAENTWRPKGHHVREPTAKTIANGSDLASYRRHGS